MAMTIPAMEMILPQGSTGNIPAFLAKLWKMVNNQDIGKHIKPLISLESYRRTCFRSSDLLVRGGEILHYKKSNRVRQVDAAPLLQTRKHGLLRETAQHVRLPQGHEC